MTKRKPEADRGSHIHAVLSGLAPGGVHTAEVLLVVVRRLAGLPQGLVQAGQLVQRNACTPKEITGCSRS